MSWLFIPFSMSEQLSGRCAHICHVSQEEEKRKSDVHTSGSPMPRGFSNLCVPFCAEDPGCWCVNITESADALDTISTQPGIADLPNFEMCCSVWKAHCLIHTFFLLFFYIFRGFISSKECISPSEQVSGCDFQ